MERRPQKFTQDSWQKLTSYFYLFRYPNRKIKFFGRSQQYFEHWWGTKYVGSWRLLRNLKRNAFYRFQREGKDHRYKIKPHETIQPKDKTKLTYSVSLQSSWIETQKQMQTIPIYHQLLYYRLVWKMAQWSSLFSRY